MTAAAAIIARREQELVDHFRQSKAISPATAKSSNELQIDENVAFRILRSREIIREAGPGLYYLDELSWEASRRRRRQFAFILILVLAAIAFSGFFFTNRAR